MGVKINLVPKVSLLMVLLAMASMADARLYFYTMIHSMNEASFPQQVKDRCRRLYGSVDMTEDKNFEGIGEIILGKKPGCPPGCSLCPPYPYCICWS